MRKLTMKMSMSLDGYVSGPNGESDWIFRSSDDTSKEWALGVMKEAGMILMGRKSYEGWETFWPTAPGLLRR